MKNELVAETLKAAPVVTYSGVYLAGISIADVVSIVMLIYGICLLIVTVPKAWQQIKEWVKSCQSKQD
jgi:hypothetical protein